MLEFEEYKVKLGELKPTLDTLRGALRLEDARAELAELREQSEQPDFWNDMENGQKVLKRIKQLENKCRQFENQ